MGRKKKNEKALYVGYGQEVYEIHGSSRAS